MCGECSCQGLLERKAMDFGALFGSFNLIEWLTALFVSLLVASGGL